MIKLFTLPFRILHNASLIPVGATLSLINCSNYKNHTTKFPNTESGKFGKFIEKELNTLNPKIRFMCTTLICTYTWELFIPWNIWRSNYQADKQIEYNKYFKPPYPTETHKTYFWTRFCEHFWGKNL